MPEAPKSIAIARCACGSVELQAAGTAILSADCYCDDCQAGGRQIEALPNAGPVLTPAGGSPYLLYRKDRVQCTAGGQLLQPHKLQETSPTNRVIATCCNSAMMLNFDDSKHWISMYRARFVTAIPPLQMRVCTKFKPADVELANDLPNYPAFPLKFIGKLIAARIAMRFDR